MQMALLNNNIYRVRDHCKIPTDKLPQEKKSKKKYALANMFYEQMELRNLCVH